MFLAILATAGCEGIKDKLIYGSVVLNQDVSRVQVLRMCEDGNLVEETVDLERGSLVLPSYRYLLED